MDQGNVNLIIDEATPVTKRQWEYIGKMVNTDIVEDFRMYAKDPARWFKRYQRQCRAYPKTINKIKELQHGQQKRQQEKQALGKDKIRDREISEGKAKMALASGSLQWPHYLFFRII